MLRLSLIAILTVQRRDAPSGRLYKKCTRYYWFSNIAVTWWGMSSRK